MSRIASQPRRPRLKGLLLGSIILVAVSLLLGCSDGGVSAPINVSQVIVQPGTHTAVVGDELSYSARVLDGQGGDLTGRPVTWSSSNVNVATVTSTGTVTALAVGEAVIRATSSGKEGLGTLTVMLAPVASVEISPTPITLIEGDSIVISAIVRDPAGRILEGRLVTWTSTAPTIISVDGDGQLTAIRAGQANVIATVEDRSATAAVNVNQVPVAAVSITPTAFVLEIGEQRQLSAELRDARGNVLQGRAVAWSVDSTTATVTPDGLLTGARSGYATIWASSEGVSSAAAATIVAAPVLPWDLLYYRMSGAGGLELFTLALDGASAPVKLNAGNVSRSPTASPDGTRVAFAVSMDELGTGVRIDDIFAVDRNGMNMRRLTTAAGLDESPAWSPAGGRIAYQHWEVNGRSDIWVMNADGTAPANLTADMPANGFRSAPAWSADGSRLAFAQMTSGPTGTTASIWIMDAYGNSRRELTNTLTGFDGAPTWSPDGERLAFVRHYGAEADITIIDIDSGALTRLPLTGLEVRPSWSPDGSLIAFSSGRTNDLFTVRPDGSRLRLRTTDPAWGGGLGPTWITRR